MDFAIAASCPKMVIELRRRGLKATAATEPFEEAALAELSGPKDARFLAEYYSLDVMKEDSTDEKKFGERHIRILERTLQLRNYELFKDFANSSNPNIRQLEARNGYALHKLVNWGHAFLLEDFIDEAFQYDIRKDISKDEQHKTLLFAACERALPNFKLLRVLVEKVKVDVNQRIGTPRPEYKNKKATALHRLVCGSHFWDVEALKYLLEKGANIEAVTNDGETPLMVAVNTRYPTGFWNQETVEYGANPNALNKKGESCLKKSRSSDITHTLIQHGADIMIGYPPVLAQAANHLNVESAKILFEAGVDPNIVHPAFITDEIWGFMKPRYPLQAIARPTEDEQCVSGWSEEKFRKMKVAMMRLFLKNGADPLAAYPDNSNDLQNVIEEHGELEPLWEIADLNLETRGRGGRTPLVSACFPRVPAHERVIPGGEPAPKAIGMPAAALVHALQAVLIVTHR